MGKKTNTQKQSQNLEPSYFKLYIVWFTAQVLAVSNRTKAIGKQKMHQKTNQNFDAR